MVKSGVGSFEQKIGVASLAACFFLTVKYDPTLQRLQLPQVRYYQLQPFIGEQGAMCREHLLPVVDALHGTQDALEISPDEP
jgi:hypothetical protein